VRLAISGGDCDHVVQVPHGRPPLLRIHHGTQHPSRLALPCLPGPSGETIIDDASTSQPKRA
jgi:uncharacterized protein